MKLRCGFLIALIVFVCAKPAYSLEWYKAYSKAQDAVKSGDCARAEPLLLEALQQNSTTGLRIPTYGTMRMEYIPHFYLAECAFKKGDIQQAATYLKEAESSGAASSSKANEFAQLRRDIDSKLQQSRVQQPPKSPPRVQQAPVPVPKETVPPKAETTPPVPRIQEQPRFDEQAAVNRALKEASAAYANGDYSTSRNAIDRVLALDPSNSEAQRLFAQIALKEAEASKTREKENKMAEINRAIRNGDWGTAENLSISLKLQYPSDQSIADLAARVQKQKESDLQKKTADEIRKFAEKQVMIAYYKGDYPTAVQLAQQNADKNPSSWRLQFFLGCSYAALALLQEDNRGPRMDLAKEAFRKARSVAGTITVPPYISPKILEIYRNS